MVFRPQEKALIAQVFKSYLAEHHHEDIVQLFTKTTEEAHHPVLVNAMSLFEASMEVMSRLIAQLKSINALHTEAVTINLSS